MSRNRIQSWALRISVSSSVVLAVGLIAQSLWEYVSIAPRLVVNHLQQQAKTVVVALERKTPATGLSAMLEQVRDSDEQTYAWLRLLDGEARPVAASANATSVTPDVAKLRETLRRREIYSEVRFTVNGKVLVTYHPTRLGPTRPSIMEVATYFTSGEAAVAPFRHRLLLANSAALALLVSVLLIALRFRDYRRGRLLEEQFAAARAVQQELLPAADPKIETVEVAAECQPAQQVGGDFYDVIEVSPDRAAIALGDVSGKGLPAALLMGLAHGAIHASPWHQTSYDHEDATARLNRLLCARTSQSRFASLFWGYHDRTAGTLRYINAGHCPPVLMRRGPNGPELKLLDRGGAVLGLLPGARHEQVEEPFGHGDTLILYSDGIVEATNTEGEEFGMERLLAAIRGSANLPVELIRAELLAAVNEFRGQEPASDDLTLLVVRARPEPGTRKGDKPETTVVPTAKAA
jgi:serine phosphatase RsbU (regulator of sigma subunit)